MQNNCIIIAWSQVDNCARNELDGCLTKTLYYNDGEPNDSLQGNYND